MAESQDSDSSDGSWRKDSSSSDEEHDSPRTKLCGVSLKSSKKTGKAKVDVKGTINMAGTATEGCDSVGILGSGEGELDIRAGGVSSNLGNAGTGRTLEGANITGFRGADNIVMNLTTPNVDSQLDPGPGEHVTAFEATTDATLTIDATQHHQMGSAPMPHQDPTRETEHGRSLPRQENTMAETRQDQASSISPRGLAAVNVAEDGGQVINEGRTKVWMNPSANQDLIVDNARRNGKVTNKKTSKKEIFMGVPSTPTNSGTRDVPRRRQLQATRTHSKDYKVVTPDPAAPPVVQVPIEQVDQRGNANSATQPEAVGLPPDNEAYTLRLLPSERVAIKRFKPQ